TGFPLPTFIIAGIGVAGFVAGLAAIIKRDRSAGAFLAVLVGLGIIFVLAAVGISSLGLFKDFPVKDSLTATEVGDVGNAVVNFGSISEKDGWIYYLYKENLYKRKADWTEKTKVSENPVAIFCISGDWIYYQDKRDGGNLFKMKTDGTGQMKIGDDQIGNFVVSDEWIFYNPMKTAEVKQTGGGLFKIKTDGTGKVKLLDVDWDSGVLKVLGDWVYCDNHGALFRMKADETEPSLITEDTRNIEYVSGEWLYYCIRTDEGKGLENIKICRIRADGTEKSVTAELSGVYVSWFDHDWFYYTSGKGLSRMKLDGTGNEKLNDVSIWALDGVSENWMYISDYAGPRFRVKLDGSVGTRIN
ncbi:MAG: DUF5050 domain-containing protein, partial [Desulfitobacteriaceae bacterium]|nr:DUF5050 domain-containing protein [Desulfitobacteriaceae bacterium]